jgi:hypothetical protein
MESKPFSCDDCGSTFSSKIAKSNHKKRYCKGQVERSYKERFLILEQEMAELKAILKAMHPEMTFTSHSHNRSASTSNTNHNNITTTSTNSNNTTTNTNATADSNNTTADSNNTTTNSNNTTTSITILNLGREMLPPSINHEAIKAAIKGSRFKDMMNQIIMDTHFNPDYPQNMNVYAQSVDGPGYIFTKNKWVAIHDLQYFPFRVMQNAVHVMADDMDEFKGQYKEETHAFFDRFFQNIKMGLRSDKEEVLRMIVNNKDIIEGFIPQMKSKPI